MTAENRKKLYEMDPVRFAAYKPLEEITKKKKVVKNGS